MWTSNRPESNKENVVPSSTSFGAPSAALSFTVPSGGQTKITEQSHYQQIKSSSVIRSESPVIPSTVLKHETTKTETRTTSGDKLLPLCVEAFQDSVLSPISGISKTKQQEVTEQSNYQKFQSSTIRSAPSHAQSDAISSGTTEIQTKSTAEKLLPVCVEAFQDSVLSPISGIKKTKKQEVIENSHYQDNLSSINHSVTPQVSSDSPRIWMSVTETRSSVAEKLLPVCVEAFQDSVLSPISGISKSKHQEVIEHSYRQQNKSSTIRSMSPTVYCNSPKPWIPSTHTSSTAENLLPLCVEAFRDSVQSPISGIQKTKKQEVLEQSNYQQNQSSAASVASLVRCFSPKPWAAPDTDTKTSALDTEVVKDSAISPFSRISRIRSQENQSSVIRPVTPPVCSTTPNLQISDAQQRTSTAEKLLPLCVEAFQDSVLSPISGTRRTKNQEVIEHSNYKQTHHSNVVPPVTSTMPSDKPRIWMSVRETKHSQAEKLLPLCVEAFQDSVLSPISGIKKTKKEEETEQSQYQKNRAKVKQFWRDRTSPMTDQMRSAAAKKLLPLCVEAFQDSVLSPISGIRNRKNQKVTETSYRQQSHSSVSHSVASSVPQFMSKPSMPQTQAKLSAEKLLPVCVEAFQDSVLSPISGIRKTKTQEIQSSVIRSVTPPVSSAAPKLRKAETKERPSTAEKLLPVCVEAFQDSVLSPISGISKTKKQEIQSSVTRSPTPPVPNTVPKPWKSEIQTGSPAAVKLLPMCVEAFQDSVLSPISGIGKTKKQEIQWSPIRSVTPPVLSNSPKPWKPETQATSSPTEKLLPLCVEAFQDSVLSPISGISKTKKQEISEQSQETKSTMIRSETPPASQKSETTDARKLLPVCVEAFRDSVLSPISGINKTKTQEVTQDGRKTEKTTTETIQETKGSCQTTIFRKEKESVVRDSFVTGNRPIFQATPLTAVMSQPSTVKMTKFESKSSETKQNVWKPTGAVAGKIREYSSNQPAGAVDKPVAPVTEPAINRNVCQRKEMESSTLPRRKKQFSSSSFYEDEYLSFPTLEEQVQLCRQIADSLVDESGKKSKGASMFDRRMKRSTSWVHENPENEDTPSTPKQTEEREMSEVDMPPRPKSKTPSSLKLILDPRLPQDVAMLKTSGQQISEHNVVSPDICHHLVKDLQSPVGKGGALFAKRKKKAEDWIVDDDKVKEHTKTPEPLPEPPVPSLHKLKEKFQNPKLKLVKSPWEAALQSPIGSVDGAFVDVKPVKLAETVIKAADYKIRSNSQSPILESGSIPHSYPFTPPASGLYKPTAPRGWTGRVTTDEYDSGTSSGAFASPEPPLMPCRPYSSAPTNKPSFQNFNTTAKTWNEAKKSDISQPSGFKPVRPPTYYAK